MPFDVTASHGLVAHGLGAIQPPVCEHSETVFPFVRSQKNALQARETFLPVDRQKNGCGGPPDARRAAIQGR
jgi:hypothetical protein